MTAGTVQEEMIVVKGGHLSRDDEEMIEEAGSERTTENTTSSRILTAFQMSCQRSENLGIMIEAMIEEKGKFSICHLQSTRSHSTFYPPPV